MTRTRVRRRRAIRALVLLASACLLSCAGPAADRETHQWLGFYNGKHTVGDYGIGIATADSIADGLIRHTSSSPIMAPSGYRHIVAPCVVRAGDLFYMYVEGFATETGSWRDVLLYTSPDGFRWTSSPDNPVLTRLGGVRRCSVLYEPNDTNREFKMWYVRSDSLDIAYAFSSDGVSWLTEDVPVLTAGEPGAWDDDHVMIGGVWKEAGTYYLFYAGHDGARYAGGYATAAFPEGPYTKSQDNPIIKARKAADQALSRDVRPGETRIGVTDSSVFQAGEAIVLCNRLGDWEVTRIASIPSKRELELAERTIQRYSVAENTRVRSWASQDVHSTCVWRQDDQWHVVTCNFGFHKGVMEIVNFMIELTGYMTGPSLSDLSWIYRASPLLPVMNSRDSDWDQCSRENLNVIRRDGRWE